MARVSVLLPDLAVFLNLLSDVRSQSLQKENKARKQALALVESVKQTLELRLEQTKEELSRVTQEYATIQKRLDSCPTSSADSDEETDAHEYKESLENTLAYLSQRMLELESRVELLATSQAELICAQQRFERDYAEACAEEKRRFDHIIACMEGYYNLIAKAINAPSFASPSTHQMVQGHETAQYDEMQKVIVRRCRIALLASPLMDEQRWNSMTPLQRKHVLDSLTHTIGRTLGLDIHGVDVCQWPAIIRGAYNGGKKILLNRDCATDPTNRLSVCRTIVHECRHAFQEAAVANPQKYAVPLSLLGEWKHNNTPENYKKYNEDPLMYRLQPIEKDAFDFADLVCKVLKSN